MEETEAPAVQRGNAASGNLPWAWIQPLSPRRLLRNLVHHARAMLRTQPRLRASIRRIPGLLLLARFVLSHRAMKTERAYSAWAAQAEGKHPEMRADLLNYLATLTDRPTISVVMPAYETPPNLLRAAILSVQRQVWPNWELCIADDASHSNVVKQVVDEFASDARIKLVRRVRNGHISAATNTAIEQVTAEWLALMDHDDVLHEHALLYVGLHIIANPDAQVIFTDEDKVDHAGRRSGVYHKPEFDPDLLLGQNMVSHFGVYRRSLIERVGGLREGFEGSQDYDLALRASRIVESRLIHHIPVVTYHWRQAASSRQSFSQAALDRCVSAARRAIAEHLVAQGIEGAEVGPAPEIPFMNRVRWPLPSPMPRVTLVLESGADPGTLPDWKGLEVLSGYSGRSEAADAAQGAVLVYLGPGCRPARAEWLRELVSQALRPEVGIAGGPVFGPEQQVLEAGWVFGGTSFAQPAYTQLKEGDDGHSGALRLVRRVSALGGSSFAMRAQTLRSVDGLDQTLQDPWQLIDLCLRVRKAGLAVLCCPEAAVQVFAPRTLTTIPESDLYGREVLLGRHGRRLLEEVHFSHHIDHATGLPRLLPQRPSLVPRSNDTLTEANVLS